MRCNVRRTLPGGDGRTRPIGIGMWRRIGWRRLCIRVRGANARLGSDARLGAVLTTAAASWCPGFRFHLGPRSLWRQMCSSGMIHLCSARPEALRKLPDRLSRLPLVVRVKGEFVGRKRKHTWHAYEGMTSARLHPRREECRMFRKTMLDELVRVRCSSGELSSCKRQQAA